MYYRVSNKFTDLYEHWRLPAKNKKRLKFPPVKYNISARFLSIKHQDEQRQSMLRVWYLRGGSPEAPSMECWAATAGPSLRPRRRPPRRARRLWLQQYSRFPVVNGRDCARIRSPRADWLHQDSVRDIIPAGPLNDLPLVVVRMPFYLPRPLVERKSLRYARIYTL